jgi:hypothetical protein
MKRTTDKKLLKKIPWTVIAVVLLAAVFLTVAIVLQNQSHQAFDAYVFDVKFVGEYRIDDGEWRPLSSTKHISSTKGNVELKGVFVLCDAQTGEAILNAEKGTIISMYLDHIKATVRDAKGNEWISDNENELLGDGVCSQTWTEYVFEGEAGDEVVITLENPHIMANGKAVDSFLENLRIYNVENHKSLFYNVGVFQIIFGILLVVFLFVLLGVALFSALLRVKYTQEIWLAWLLVFFGGVYFIFCWDKIAIWSTWHAINMVMLGASMMLYLLIVQIIVVRFFDSTLKKIAIPSVVLLGTVSLLLSVASISTSIKFFDTYPYWITAALFSSVIVLICTVVAIVKERKNTGLVASRKIKYVYVPIITVLIAFIIGAIFTVVGIWQGGVLSVIIFFLILLSSVVIIGRVVPQSIKTVVDAKNIEAEKREMELKLQESKISIMLSQIQPHFLYNTLNSIYQLCETNPMLARTMVNSFAEYLRNNLSSLDEPGLIAFTTELEHVKTYLEIEKIRFDDTLEIEYDIRCVDFQLPVLTVQPIVENAVKHGTSRKRGGGKVTISTREDDEFYIVTVSDTGCGFDPAVRKDDGKKHVGIENVRQRLSNMCGGVLTIESEIGVGTVVNIRIPKEV